MKRSKRGNFPTVGAVRADFEKRNEGRESREFLVLIDPAGDPVKRLLQVAQLYNQHEFNTGCDLTFGDLPDDATQFLTFTYDGSLDSFWDGLRCLTEAIILDMSGYDDGRLPGVRAFEHMLSAYSIPPLAQLPDMHMAPDGRVTESPEWSYIGA